MKTNANKSAAGAAFPSTRLTAPARSLGAARARLATHAETRPAPEKRLKAVAPAPASTRPVKATKGREGKEGKAEVQTVGKAKAATKNRTRVLGRGKSALKAPAAKRAGKVIKSAAGRVRTKSAAVKPAAAAKPEQKHAALKAAVQQVAGLRRSVLSAAGQVANEVKVPAGLKPEAAPAANRGATAEAPRAEAPRPTETRSAPAVVPSSAPTHAGRGDATLARYMSELAGYELLGRDDEIRLAQEVETLEIAYWRALLALPRAFEVIEPAIKGNLEELPSELPAVAKAAHAALTPAAGKAAGAAKALLTRYERAAEKLAVQLRAADIHRDAAKATYRAVHELAEGSARTRPAQQKQLTSFLREVDSARRAQQAAKDRFVAANLRLVVSMARRYAREGRMPLADLIQEGNLGLMKAVERFDHRRGFRFSTYASWWIRHALTRGLADKGRLVRLPVHALETRTRLARATRKLTCRTGVAPTLDELAAETGLAPEKLPAMEELSTEAPFSLDAPVSGDNDRTFLDMLRYEDQASAEERVVSASHKESLASLMGELSPFEAQILRYRYGFDGGEERTLKEIGQMYNLSRERIRQIQASALAVGSPGTELEFAL